MTSQEFCELLLDRAIETRCPACHRRDWRGTEDTIRLPVVTGTGTLRYWDSTKRANPNVDVIAPSCGNCGHVRIFDSHFLGAEPS